MRFGVDFGTTRTVVACADRGNYPVLSFTDDAGDAQEWFPSVVAERGGRLHFGFDALALAGEDARLTRSFKRWLTDPHAIPSTPVQVGSLTLPLGDLLTQFLSAVREAIATRSNLGQELDPSELRSVIGVPANAHGGQRLVTLDAFRRAGFAPVAMLNEPSAAGFEFTHRHRASLNSRREHVVIYDLGGGTFDASLVHMRGLQHEVLATAGVNRLGGDDFDALLLELVLARAGLSASQLTAAQLERLRDQCREAKERLTPSSRKISIDLEQVGEIEGAPKEVTLAVSDFYEACAPLVERSIEAMAPVMARLPGTSDPASGRFGSSDPASGIAGVYVVGGASALPIVPRELRKRFGRRVHRSPYPSAAVAIGLAIACDETSGFELTDRFSRTFGVFREGADGLEITFDPIFTDQTDMPRPSAAPLLRRRIYRAAHNIGHFRFLECSGVGADGKPRGDIVLSGDVLFPFDAKLREGALDLSAVPVQRIADSGPRIEEEYALDEHGVVAVTIKNLDQNYQRVYRVGGSA